MFGGSQASKPNADTGRFCCARLGDSAQGILAGPITPCRQFHIGTVVAVDSSLPGCGPGHLKSEPDEGEVKAFRLGDGAEQWTINLKGTIRSFGSDDKVLYIGTLAGMVTAYGSQVLNRSLDYFVTTISFLVLSTIANSSFCSRSGTLNLSRLFLNSSLITCHSRSVIWRCW